MQSADISVSVKLELSKPIDLGFVICQLDDNIRPSNVLVLVW